MLTTPVLHTAPAGHAALAAPAALGGTGLVHLILRLFIWRMIWRLGLLIWHIRTVGPVVLLLVVAVLIGVAVSRSRRRRARGTSDGTRPEPGSRDW